MELTVKKAGLNTCLNYGNYKKNDDIVKTANPSVNNKINLNNDPKAIAFKGFFFKKKPADPYFGEERIYGGKYKVCKKEIKDNDLEALLNVDLACYSFEGPKDIDEPYNTQRVDDKDIGKLSSVCLALFAYYARDTKTSFPQFYDLMARALPKACAERDKKSMNDNASRMYEGMNEKINKYGKLCDPTTTNTFESGVKYLYFSNDVPTIEYKDSGITGRKALFKMGEGKTPDVARYGGDPRCCMSWVADEIHAYGTPYIIQHFATEKTANGATNRCGMKYNPNIAEAVVIEKYEPEMVEIDPWEYNP